MYDIIIIGAGVCGAMIARELSKYKLNILVIEKENDCGDGASGANSAIIHSGYDPKPGSLKAKLNVLGNSLYDKICEDLCIPFKRIGSITLANSMEECETLLNLAKRSEQNNVPYKILSNKELKEIEPNIKSDVISGLLAPTAGIINPFELVIAAMENAMDNGVNLSLNDCVTSITRENDTFKVVTTKDIYISKYVINAAGVFADKINEMVNPKSFTITPRRGEYYVLDHFDNNFCKHTLFNVPSKKGKGVLISPTTSFNYLVGPSSENIFDKEDVATHKDILNNVKEAAYNLMDNIMLDKQIRQFSGLRAVSDNDDFIIEETSTNFINVAGIQSPGLSSAPAIAIMVSKMIKNKEINPTFNPKRRPRYDMKSKTIEERNKLIIENPELGKVICRCEQITEGEIIDCIKRNCGATTVKGVKKRVRPGFGKCQGGFCESLVVDILSKQLNKPKTEIMYGKSGTYILLEETKGESHE